MPTNEERPVEPKRERTFWERDGALKRKRRAAVLFPVMAAVGIGLAVWWQYGRGRMQRDAPPAMAKVIRRAFTSTVLATGAVKPQVGAEVRVGCRISGRVERLHTNIGDAVTKGQVIAELEKADLEATVAQRRAELQLAEAKLSAVQNLGPKEIEKAEADVARWQATVTATKKELARQNDLLKQEVTSQRDWDRAREQLSVAQAQLASTRKALELAKTRYAEDTRQARAEVERAKAAQTNVQVQRSYATITAPISGVIASVSTQEGETVAASLNAPTFVTIIDLGRLQVDAYVDEVDIGKIRRGQKATFTVDAFPAREFAGKVTAIYPKAVIQENVVNYDVVIEIVGPYEDVLRPEMTASVTLFLEARPNVLAVPMKAVKRAGGKTIAYVLTDGHAEPQEIKVGGKSGEWVEVVAGVQEGQTVLLQVPALRRTQR